MRSPLSDPLFLAMIGGPPPVTDPNFSSVSLLLPFDGTDGSTTFTDLSANNIFMTRATAGPTISTAQSKYGGSSLFTSGVEANIRDEAARAELLLDDDLTIECDARTTSTGDQIICGAQSPNNQIFRLNFSGPGSVFIFLANTFFASSDNIIAINTWHHYALTRSGITIRLFVDGIQRGSVATSESIRLARIGSVFGAGFVGHIDNFRVTKGIARYTANFTPPTAPFPTS